LRTSQSIAIFDFLSFYFKLRLIFIFESAKGPIMPAGKVKTALLVN
jgi:hypothetical protein